MHCRSDPVVLVVVVALVVLEPAAIDEARSKLQGTGTSFPAEPEVLVVVLVVVLEVPVEVPAVVLEGVAVPLLLVSDNERIAKSTRPEVGSRMTSLIVPRLSPVELFTSAPINLLARTSPWEPRPVALRRPPTWLLELPLYG